MKIPKTEPYKRSLQRAALHTWVVAATTVASIGMGSAASARDIRPEPGATTAMHDSVDLDAIEDLKKPIEP